MSRLTGAWRLLDEVGLDVLTVLMVLGWNIALLLRALELIAVGTLLLIEIALVGLLIDLFLLVKLWVLILNWFRCCLIEYLLIGFLSPALLFFAWLHQIVKPKQNNYYRGDRDCV